jgi:NAD(P)-dependent dehydrogenase (short-subunit alcohol dehydrogenase family)
LEARKHGIRVNAVSPGFLYTKMIDDALKRHGEVGQTVWKAYEARQGRQAIFSEIGDATVLLSTPRMSLVNGHNLVIDK